MQDVTIVTALYDMGREKLAEPFKRNFEQYWAQFENLAKTDVPMLVYCAGNLKDRVLKARGGLPTSVRVRELEEFRTWFPFWDKLQAIRTNPKWSDQGWLKESPQARLEFYNPVLMSKMFMVNDAAVMNPLSTRYFFWLDAGITSTVNAGYFREGVLDQLPQYCGEDGEHFACLSYPYESDTEVHGFDAKALAKLCGVPKTRYVCRGGFFGGCADTLREINAIYYRLLGATLDAGLMGADECIFTIIAHNFTKLVRRFELKPEDRGLCSPFFEYLKQQRAVPVTGRRKALSTTRQSMYIITFNFPQQLRMLLDSLKAADADFLERPARYLINNSTDRTTDADYKALADAFKLEVIHQGDNIGICGGRQLAAEHFAKTDADYMTFFEDDMLLAPPGNAGTCPLGFRRYVPNLYDVSLQLMHREGYDFLKFSFSEFFGHNAGQWAWTNLPRDVRRIHYADYPDPRADNIHADMPPTVFRHIRNMKGLACVDGEVFYSNWPGWVSREGNQKLFLDVKWAHPNEQTWMSRAFQEIKAGNIRGAVLLASPVAHDRKFHYAKEARKES